MSKLSLTFADTFTARQPTGAKLLTAMRLDHGLGRYAGLARPGKAFVQAPAVWTWPTRLPSPGALAWALYAGFILGVLL